MTVNGKERSSAKNQRIAKIIELERQFGLRIRSQSLRDWMAIGLTTVQLKSLFFIVRTNNANSKKLSDALGVTPANITGVIDRLIERGMVHRYESAEDRRITLLKGTAKGKKLIASLDKYVYESLAKFLVELSDEDLDHLELGLSAFIKAWDEDHKEKQLYS